MALVGAITLAALRLADFGWAQRQGLSALTLAIVLGMVVGNTFFGKIAPRTAAGVDYAKHSLLRAAIVLYGFRVLLSDIAQVGMAGVLIDMCVLSLTFTLALLLGTRVLGIDRHTAMLIGAGSSICGAAAVLATQPVLKAHAHKVSVAVATVVVFGTLSMVLYPLMYPYLGMSAHTYGLYTGATVHEVAQVVAIGKAIDPNTAQMAVIVKMVRVMMLAPFLMLVMWVFSRHAVATPAEGKAEKTAITIPWFAFGFIAVAGLNSLHLLPSGLVQAIQAFDVLLLCVAMVALGFTTQISVIKNAGVKPILLASVLFVLLLSLSTLSVYLLNPYY